MKLNNLRHGVAALAITALLGPLLAVHAELLDEEDLPEGMRMTSGMLRNIDNKSRALEISGTEFRLGLSARIIGQQNQTRSFGYLKPGMEVQVVYQKRESGPEKGANVIAEIRVSAFNPDGLLE